MKNTTKNQHAISYDDVFSYDHLYKSYLKCRRACGWKASTQKFIAQAPVEVYKLWNDLNQRKWKSSGFVTFTIKERGKTRLIQSVTFSERIVQRTLCDYALTPAITKRFIYDNGASQKGKGYHFAISRCKKHLINHIRKHGTNGYVLTFDFKNYFGSIDHDYAKSIIEKSRLDDDLKSLCFYLIDCFGNVGIGLGSQISQILALAVADRLDHAIKEQMRIKGYGRYMDDGYLIADSKDELKECLVKIRSICQSCGIVLNEKKTQIRKLSSGFTFLKCRFLITASGHVVQKMPHDSIVRQRRKMKKLAAKMKNEEISKFDFYQSYQSWRAYASHFNSYKTIRSMDELYVKLIKE